MVANTIAIEKAGQDASTTEAQVSVGEQSELTDATLTLLGRAQTLWNDANEAIDKIRSAEDPVSKVDRDQVLIQLDKAGFSVLLERFCEGIRNGLQEEEIKKMGEEMVCFNIDESRRLLQHLEVWAEVPGVKTLFVQMREVIALIDLENSLGNLDLDNPDDTWLDRLDSFKESLEKVEELGLEKGQIGRALFDALDGCPDEPETPI